MPELSPSDGEIGAKICRLIAEALDIGDAEVAVDDDFFELGGSSLKGAMLIALITRRLGVRLTLGDLYEEPTAAGLAGRIRETSSCTTVFLIHSYTTDLAREIARRRPLVILSYVLAAEGDADGWPPPVGIEALARHYVAEMRELRPTGPYYLAGYSLGGIIAWEMVRQLVDDGAEIGLLCVIDAPPPEVRRRRLSRRHVLINVASTSPRILVDKAWHRVRNAVEGTTWVRRRRWRRSDNAVRLMQIDHRLEAYRMHPLPAGCRLLLIDGTADTPSMPGVLFASTPPAARAYQDLGLVPEGFDHLRLLGSHHAIAVSPLAGQVAAAIDHAMDRFAET